MNYFLKANKNLLTYSLIILIVIPIFGINFFISFLGNILLLLFLIPLLLVVLVFIAFNSYKSKINTCNNCGAISLGLNETCMNCGAYQDNISNNNQFNKIIHDIYCYLLYFFLFTRDILAITTLQHCPKYKITPNNHTHKVSTRNPPIKPYA